MATACTFQDLLMEDIPVT